MQDVLSNQENYDEGLLVTVKHSKAGQIVVPTGGVLFSACDQEKYKESLELKLK